jgi:hypothetical protein
MPSRRAFGLGAGALALLAPHAASAKPAWTLYRYKEEGYSVAFPELPVLRQLTEKTANGPLPVKALTAHLGPDTFSTHFADYAVLHRHFDPEAAVEGVVAAAAPIVQGTMQGDRRLTVHGMPAREIIINSPKFGVLARQRYIFHNQRLYTFLAIGTEGAIPADVDYFFDSAVIA